MAAASAAAAAPAAAAARAPTLISSQRGATCVPDAFFTILEFSDTTKDRFAELRSLVTANAVAKLSATQTHLRTNTFGGPSFQTKKLALHANNIRNLPLIAHLQRSYRRITEAPPAPTSGPLVRSASTNTGEGAIALNLISSSTGIFGSAPTSIGCSILDIERYGRNILQTHFNPSFGILLNPAFHPGREFGIMIQVAFTNGTQHVFGLCYNNGILCLVDNNVGFLHEIREDRFMNEFLQAYNAAPDKTNINTIEIFSIPGRLAGPNPDLEYFFHIPATGFTYGYDVRIHPVKYTSTLFLLDTRSASGIPMNAGNSRKSRKSRKIYQRRRKTTRRRRHD